VRLSITREAQGRRRLGSAQLIGSAEVYITGSGQRDIVLDERHFLDGLGQGGGGCAVTETEGLFGCAGPLSNLSTLKSDRMIQAVKDPAPAAFTGFSTPNHQANEQPQCLRANARSNGR